MNALELLPPDASHVGSFTVADQIGVKFQEPVTLSYLNAPLDVYRTQQVDGERFDVVVNHPPLVGTNLLDLLGVVAPSDAQDSPRGVTADWHIVDDARLLPARNVSPFLTDFSKRLVSIHEVMGYAWAEFVDSRAAFIDVVESMSLPDFVPRHDFGWVSLGNEDFVRATLKHKIASDIESTEQVVDILNAASISGAEGLLYLAIGDQLNSKRKNDSKITRRDTMDSRFQKWGYKQKREFVGRLLDWVGADGQKAFIDAAIDLMYERLELDDGRKYVYPRNELGNVSLAERYEARKTVTRGDFQAEIITLRDKKGECETVLPGSVRRVTPAATISPLISWQRDKNGRRSLVIERGVKEDDIDRVDGVLGAVALAYFTPGERKLWPAKMGLKGGRYEQNIGAAQVPVLALMRRARLLDSPFVEASESLDQ